VIVDGRTRTATGGALLLNGQANYGTIVASAANSADLVPLNAGSPVTGSSVTINGNAVAASAYGNSATNRVSLSLIGAGPAGAPSAAIANFQTNMAPVTALVSGSAYPVTAGPLTASTLAITGNSLAATAVGNQASSAIAGPR
jgi:hypothetical protein